VLLVEGLKHNLINHVPKIADEEETTLKKKSAVEVESAAGNQSTEKEI